MRLYRGETKRRLNVTILSSPSISTVRKDTKIQNVRYWEGGRAARGGRDVDRQTEAVRQTERDRQRRLNVTIFSPPSLNTARNDIKIENGRHWGGRKGGGGERHIERQSDRQTGKQRQSDKQADRDGEN